MKTRLISMAANCFEDEGISNLEIRDKTLSRGVHSTFSSRNSFIVYGVQRGEETEEWDTQYLHEIRPKSALYNTHVRKLVNESQSIFIALNAEINGFQNDQKNIDVLNVSQQYRSVLLACVEDLVHATESAKTEELHELRDMFSDIELLWHLLQSLIIDDQCGSRILYKLLDWIKWHYLFAERKMEEITVLEEPSGHPEYWDTIIQFLLQGKITAARSLLVLHKKYEREDFRSLEELLKQMPMYVSSCRISLNEFRMRWKHWQEECVARLESGEFCSDQGLETVCKILCGDVDTLTEKSNLCGNWYHLMISVLLYTNPCVTIQTLGEYARIYYNSVQSNDFSKVGIVDSIILAAMELDIVNVINLACSFNDGWWFAVHMMDLLAHGGYIFPEQQKQNYIRQYRSFLLMNYADTLMSHSSLWQVGVDYLDQCEGGGRELMETYLERIPLTTENKARKIICIAKQRNLENLVKTVSNVMTSRAFKDGMLGTALSWIIQSKDSHFADELADRWMKDYSERRKTGGLDILKNMGSYMLISDKLTFVGKYCEFHKLYAEGEFKAAATLLVSLISSGIAPPSFQMIMLLDSYPLLNSSELIFSSKDTYQLMKCLEDAFTSHKHKGVLDGNEKLNIIRLALVQNLAKAFVIEPGDSEPEEDL